MISHQTVFILGAGASAPYEYPTGKILRKIICKESVENFRDCILNSPSISTPRKVNLKSDIEELSRVFYDSSTSSIDLFLSRNHRFADIGRMAIALSILLKEETSRFREDIRRQSPDWYSFLFNKMTNTLTEPDSYKYFKDNKVSFITFNYDRSFEYFLYESLINSFTTIPLQETKIKELIPFPIQHVYGVVEKLPWQDSEKGIEYRSFMAANDKYQLIEKVKDNIRVIYDRVNDDIEEMKKLIRAAGRIFFLGFGFAQENLEILGIPEVLKHQPNIYGTAFGWTEKEIEDLRGYLQSKFPQKEIAPLLNNPYIKNINCYELLREYL